MAKRTVINRFNNLTSKEWLPFQKSFFKYTSKSEMYIQNLRFFTKCSDEEAVNIYFLGSDENSNIFKALKKDFNFNLFTGDIYENQKFDFIVFDIIEEIENSDIEKLSNLKESIIEKVHGLFESLSERKFLWIIADNKKTDKSFYPFAWDLAKSISSVLSLKDEKIGCLENGETFYSLYFRKDDRSKNLTVNNFNPLFDSSKHLTETYKVPKWFILKPQPRKKDEILHPAKYPEDLIDLFVNQFSKPGDNIFDPMSGTGSTQVGALRNGRNAFGTELSEFFCDIANNRCKKLEQKNNDYKILNLDTRKIQKDDFPEIDYILTSPPYWDMLNMKGAENQAKRRDKGLQLNYSEEKNDLGNITDYNEFLDELVKIYFDLFKLLKPGGYVTIVVKNIKKKGSNYPFAWDLAEKLSSELVLLPECFWCQDDLSIAPYGYGNTWVSNTFHHYCLNFRKAK
ncbi:MAG: site-specific DNA-methyltransferase [Saprospiraceae bacterium]|nr:site-specific DNA-methyltransferase [Saprospiraceae bacterium]